MDSLYATQVCLKMTRKINSWKKALLFRSSSSSNIILKVVLHLIGGGTLKSFSGDLSVISWLRPQSETAVVWMDFWLKLKWDFFHIQKPYPEKVMLLQCEQGCGWHPIVSVISLSHQVLLYKSWCDMYCMKHSRMSVCSCCCCEE